jgi:hypothetical protein
MNKEQPLVTTKQVMDTHTPFLVNPKLEHYDPRINAIMKKATWNYMGTVQICYN